MQLEEVSEVQLMTIPRNYFQIFMLWTGLLVAGCALLPPVSPDQVKRLSNEDLIGALYNTGGTQDFIWQSNQPDRTVVLDEIQNRKILTPVQISQLLNKSKVNWPKLDESKTDVLLAVGEPDTKSNDGAREIWTYSLNISGKLFNVHDTRTVCFRGEKVAGMSMNIDQGDGNYLRSSIDC
jgi:hypothetical protein